MTIQAENWQGYMWGFAVMACLIVGAGTITYWAIRLTTRAVWWLTAPPRKNIGNRIRGL